jgi:competence protein ComEA
LAVTEAAKDKAFLWLRRSDQLFVSLMVVSLLALLGVHWLRLSRWGMAPVELSSQEPREYYYSLDINSASWVEWAQLDGIGETLARRIVANREEHGPFRTPADVGRVKGVGPKVLEKMKPFLRGGTNTMDAPSAQ